MVRVIRLLLSTYGKCGMFSKEENIKYGEGEE